MSTEAIKNIESAMASKDVVAEPVVEVVETPVEAPEVVEAVGEGQEQTTDSAPVDGEDAPARSNKGVGKRINELTRQRHEAERRAAEAEKLLAEIRQSAPKPAAESPVSDGRPTLADFNWDTEAHADALVDWKLKQRDEAAKKKAEQDSQQKRLSEYQKRADEFADEHPDYQEKIDSLMITQYMQDAILETDVEPMIAYHLANNPSEAEEIAKKTPQGQILAIGRLAAKLSDTPAAPAATPSRPAPPVPATPPPPPPSIAARAPATLPVDKWDMSQHMEAVRSKSRR